MYRRTFLAAASSLLAGCAIPPAFRSQVFDRKIDNLELILQNSGDTRYLDIRAPQGIIGTSYAFARDLHFDGSRHYVFAPCENLASAFGVKTPATPEAAISDLTSIANPYDLGFFVDLQKRVMDSPYKDAVPEHAVIVPASLLKRYNEVSYVKKYPSEIKIDEDREVDVTIPAEEFETQLLFYGNAWRQQILKLADYVHVSPAIADLAGRLTKDYEKPEYKAQVLLNFVQSFDYVKDPKPGPDVPRFPLATLLIRGGDCEDKSLLYAALLKAVGIPCVLIHVPEHVLVGVVGDFEGNHVVDGGRNYFSAETTQYRMSIGANVIGDVEAIQFIDPHS